MAFDEARGRVVVCGGNGDNPLLLNDTWEWDGANWTQRSVATRPLPRLGHTLAFDPARGVSVLFGGRDDVQRFADTWTWDGTSWTQLTPTTSPAPRC